MDINQSAIVMKLPSKELCSRLFISADSVSCKLEWIDHFIKNSYSSDFYYFFFCSDQTHVFFSSLQDSLHSLMATLSSSNPFFVRCIKPNTQKVRLLKERPAWALPKDSLQEGVPIGLASPKSFR